MGFWKFGPAAVMAAGLALAGAALPAGAQSPYSPTPLAPTPPPPPPPPGAVVPPPPSAEAADIAACLCLRRQVDALGADMTARKSAYDAGLSEVGGLDSQLQSARASLNVNDPQAVAHFRQLLERRDAAYRHSSGATFSAYSSVVQRYNSRSDEYNARCANRPRNPVLLGQVQATLTCPAY
jgi:hypothetical protein